MVDRPKLRPYFDKRSRFRGTFSKYGRKEGYKEWVEMTVLLTDVVAVNRLSEVLTTHLWFNFTRGFQQADLRSGDIVEFNARVTMYRKGYSEDSEENPIRYDYHLSNPRKIEKVGRAEGDFTDQDLYNQKVITEVAEYEQQRRDRIAKLNENSAKPEFLNMKEFFKVRKVKVAKKLDDFFE